MNFVVKSELMLAKWKSVESAAKMKKCVEKVAREMCLERRMKRMLSDVARVWERAARERLFLLLGHDLIRRLKGAEVDTELGEKQSNKMSEARAKRGGDSGNEVLRVYRMKQIEDIAYSG